MSVLYNRLKNAEKGKKPETPISEEEGFPIEGEIKRQKVERRRRRKWGMLGGLFLFFVLIFVGALVMSIKEVTKDEQNSKPAAKISLTSQKAKSSSASEKVKPVSPSKKTGLAISKEITEKSVSQTAGTPVKPEASLKELFEQGTQLYKQSKYKEAIDAYMKGLQDNPQYAVGYNNLGVAYYKQDKLQKSSSQLKLAVELNPRYAEAHYNLAIVLERLGQEKKALIHYLKFLEFAPKKQKELQDKVQTHIRYYY